MGRAIAIVEDEPAIRANYTDALTRHGYEVEWHSWPMPHSICAEEIEAISAFLGRALGGSHEAPARSSILLPGR